MRENKKGIHTAKISIPLFTPSPRGILREKIPLHQGGLWERMIPLHQGDFGDLDPPSEEGGSRGMPTS